MYTDMYDIIEKLHSHTHTHIGYYIVFKIVARFWEIIQKLQLDCSSIEMGYSVGGDQRAIIISSL